MQRRRTRTATVALAAALLVAVPAEAHRIDVVTPNKAGPIRREETTMRQMRRWFGRPDKRRIVQVGCVKVVKARWDEGLMVYAHRNESRTIGAVFVRARRVISARHGELDMHTAKGLRVGDRRRKLHRLYPRSEPMTHGGHSHYRLRTAKNGPYLMAKVVDRRVVRLESWPFEFC